MGESEESSLSAAAHVEVERQSVEQSGLTVDQPDTSSELFEYDNAPVGQLLDCGGRRQVDNRQIGASVPQPRLRHRCIGDRRAHDGRARCNEQHDGDGGRPTDCQRATVLERRHAASLPIGRIWVVDAPNRSRRGFGGGRA